MEDAATRVNPVQATQGMAQSKLSALPIPEYFDPYERNDRRIWPWGLLTVGLLAALVALIILLVNAIGDSSDSDIRSSSNRNANTSCIRCSCCSFVVDLRVRSGNKQFLYYKQEIRSRTINN